MKEDTCSLDQIGIAPRWAITDVASGERARARVDIRLTECDCRGIRATGVIFLPSRMQRRINRALVGRSRTFFLMYVIFSFVFSPKIS